MINKLVVIKKLTINETHCLVSCEGLEFTLDKKYESLLKKGQQYEFILKEKPKKAGIIFHE